MRLPICIKVPRPIRRPWTTISTVWSCSGRNGNRAFGASCFTLRPASRNVRSRTGHAAAGCRFRRPPPMRRLWHRLACSMPTVKWLQVSDARRGGSPPRRAPPRNKPLADDGDHRMAPAGRNARRGGVQPRQRACRCSMRGTKPWRGDTETPSSTSIANAYRAVRPYQAQQWGMGCPTSAGVSDPPDMAFATLVDELRLQASHFKPS